jgi:hypothetical protein
VSNGACREAEVEEKEAGETSALNVELLQSGSFLRRDVVPECFNVSSYMFEDETNAKRGQCLPSQSPGAYTTDNSTDMWQCWNSATAARVRTVTEAKFQGYDGICHFADYGKNVDPADVPECDHVPADCNPGHSMFWGACYTNESESWNCLAQPSDGDDTTIRNMAQGDCKAVPRRDTRSKFFDGVCRFPEVARTFYKCDTVTTFDAADATTCGNNRHGHGFNSACFSLQSRVNWQCFKNSLDNPNCMSTPTGVGGNYDGACYFEQADEYANATSMR